MPPPAAPRRPPDTRKYSHSFGASPQSSSGPPPRGPPPQAHPRGPPGRGPPPKGPWDPNAEPKGPLRKVDSKNEYKGQRLSASNYSPLVGPSSGGIQRVSLSQMTGNPNGKFNAPKIMSPPRLKAKAAPPKESPKPAAARIHQHAPAEESALSAEWTQHWDEEVGSHYYFNSTTGEATWVAPDA